MNSMEIKKKKVKFNRKNMYWLFYENCFEEKLIKTKQTITFYWLENQRYIVVLKYKQTSIYRILEFNVFEIFEYQFN